MLTRIWVALPKYVCWKVWAARYYGIFEDKFIHVVDTSIAAKSIMNEALQRRIHKDCIYDIWTLEEEIWINFLLSKIFLILLILR